MSKQKRKKFKINVVEFMDRIDREESFEGTAYERKD